MVVRGAQNEARMYDGCGNGLTCCTGKGNQNMFFGHELGICPLFYIRQYSLERFLKSEYLCDICEAVRMDQQTLQFFTVLYSHNQAGGSGFFRDVWSSVCSSIDSV